ncbi:glycoside hydrolase family 2 protein [Seonamhaeicola marinus]|uniref:Glycoside hydrolase family 2 protein n=1 Tax=Seonamhaeicola marinus TaxID=1912246 RepID=A0A5D0IZW3_9FLAO|nr:glycoside hydrolase family 2 TIM barrel-domain containing protein [Seonamhaeicola marinus]TYA89224.1 glycoside hydrolase family 2 protein [Seonamhaeicola marinus]
MKNIAIMALLIAFCMGCDNTSYQTIAESKIQFNSGWKFYLVKDSLQNDNEFGKIGFIDKNWENVSLPHTAYIEPLVVNNQWQGECWYRKTFNTPVDLESGQKVFLELEGAMNVSTVWINNKLVTEHSGGYLPVVADITSFLNTNDINTIAIKLNNEDNKFTGPKPLKRLDFNMYGGLYRNAWLHLKNPIHITHPVLAKKASSGGVFITYPKVDEKESVVNIKTHIANESENVEEIVISNKIYFENELVKEVVSSNQVIKPGTSTEYIENIELQLPNLWSPKTPNLYTLKTVVSIGETVLDKQENTFGIRAYTFDEDHQLYINGEKTFLRGVNRHQEYPYVGYALSDNAQYRDAKKIKEAGFNYIRLSHYPHSESFMNACDELGLIVIDAILGWQYYLDDDRFREYCYRSANELILRDRNHPCVLAWEVSLNETKMPMFFMEEMHNIVHTQYPGANVYSSGWMHQVYDIYLQARQHRILHGYHEEIVKQKPYSVSEYGDWEYYSTNAGLNQDKLPNGLRLELSSRQLRGNGEKRLQYQADNVQEAHNDNLSTPAYSDSYWVMYDYNRGYHQELESSGIMDIFRLPKFSYYFYQSQRDISDGGVLKIANYWTKNSPLSFKVYSNYDEVALYLNDKLIDKKHPDTDEISKNLKHPPFSFSIPKFKKGTLRAVGFNNGEPLEETFVKTPEAAMKLKVWLDESGVSATANVNDVLFLYIAAIDQNGTIIPEFTENVNLNITGGEIEILNKEPLKMEAGIAAALIRIKGKTETVNVKAMSKNLEGDYKFEITNKHEE